MVGTTTSTAILVVWWEGKTTGIYTPSIHLLTSILVKKVNARMTRNRRCGVNTYLAWRGIVCKLLKISLDLSPESVFVVDFQTLSPFTVPLCWPLINCVVWECIHQLSTRIQWTSPYQGLAIVSVASLWLADNHVHVQSCKYHVPSTAHVNFTAHARIVPPTTDGPQRWTRLRKERPPSAQWNTALQHRSGDVSR